MKTNKFKILDFHPSGKYNDLAVIWHGEITLYNGYNNGKECHFFRIECENNFKNLKELFEFSVNFSQFTDKIVFSIPAEDLRGIDFINE